MKSKHHQLFSKILLILESAIFLIVLMIFIDANITGLTLFEFVDETEKFVAAQMINDGSKLYKDIFAHHGPLPYLFVHLYTNLVSNTDFTYVRSINFILAFISGIAIFLSPIFKKITEKLWAMIFFFTMLSAVWLVQGLNFVLYHPLSGLLISVPLMHLGLPALFDKKITKLGAFFSGFFIVSMCFLSYSLGITTILLLAAALLAMVKRKPLTKAIIFYFLSGSAISLLIVLLWLLIFGDPIGYLAYHFYFNLKIYSKFVNFNLLRIFDNFQLSFKRITLVHLVSIIQFAAWMGLSSILLLNQKQNNRFFKFASLFFIASAILFLNPYGTQVLKNAGFVIGNILLFSSIVTIFISTMFKDKTQFWMIAVIILLAVFMKFVSDNAVSALHHLPKSHFDLYHVQIKPSSEDAYTFTREITNKDEKILSLVLNPIEYIKADRLPASGHYYYLPWQAAYSEAPFLGFQMDICDDLNTTRPKVIWFNDWQVWDSFSLGSYEPCITDFIDQYYTESSYPYYFIRNDVQRNH
jgi:hypothetical protein